MQDNEAKANSINVVLYWHMHQPEYRDLRNGEYHQPWTYLHTIKDYVDMVAHLENNQHARAVVNFAPVLIEQINDYTLQLHDYLTDGKALRDPLLAALADPVLSQDADTRMHIIKSCLRSNKQHLIDRYEPYKALYELADDALKSKDKLVYYSDQFVVDLLVWYHLAWTAETVRMNDQRIVQLMQKARHFSLHDRRLLIEVFNELISGVLARYKALAVTGRIELSMSPYAHPILPLLLNIESATEAMPDIELPLSNQYPGGDERSKWHMREGVQVYQDTFGFAPQGCWPSEGSVSEDTIELLSSLGVRWVASGESVLRNSMSELGASDDACVNIGYRLKDTKTVCFFRDDGLSDLIGFKYSTWHADDAVANLVHNLELIAQKCAGTKDAIISIILDGENAWEYYPFNGYHFISALYESLVNHESINLTTYSEYLEASREERVLDKIVAGSWVYGTFSTWIGDKDKNRAWDMLVEAKKTYDKVMLNNSFTDEHKSVIDSQLATCESSDWFWWFGEYNSAESVAAFDEQFRLHLSNLYQLLGVEAPEYLATPFSFGSGDPAMGGAMLPGKHQ